MSRLIVYRRSFEYLILLWRRRKLFWVVERRDWASGCAATRDRKRQSSTAQTVADDTASPVPSHCAILFTIFRTIVQLFIYLFIIYGKLCSRRGQLITCAYCRRQQTFFISIRMGNCNLYVDCCLSAVE